MILSIVQARMSSTRLPGKVMKKILGKPLIGYLLGRLSVSQKIDKIVVATSKKKIDDPLVNYVRKLGFDVFRGSANDVSTRYYQAAKRYQPAHIVRITGDCPLIDPKICDQLIALYQKEKADYARLSFKFAVGLGCEIFSFKTLKYIYQNAKDKSDREHVTFYIHKHLDSFKIVELPSKTDDRQFRIVVDYPQDLKLVKTIMKAFLKKGLINFSFAKIKKFLIDNPSIRKLNAQIIKKEGVVKPLKI